MNSFLTICSVITFAFALPGSAYELPDSVPQPVVSQPFDNLVTNYVRGIPKDFRYGGGEPTAVQGKMSNAVMLDNNATVYRGFGSESFGECMCSPEQCANGLSMCIWFKQTPDQREASKRYIPNTVFSTGVENVGEDLIQGSGVGLFLRPSGLMKAMVRTPKKQYTADLPAYLFENTTNWHPVCITFNKETGLKTYYKGQVRDWDQYGLNVTGSLLITDRLIFGRPFQRPAHYFYGTFDNFLMWTREFNATQINDIYQQAPTGCEDCDPNADCTVADDTPTTCACKSGFTGDGRSCQKANEALAVTPADDPDTCWSFDAAESTPEMGDSSEWKDNDLLTGSGIQERGVVFNGRRSWLTAGDFSGTCLSDPDLCDGLTVNYWIRYEGRGDFDNYIFSSGGRGDKNTGFCCWVLGTTMTCRLQAKNHRWQASTELTRGRWQMHTIVWTTEGLKIMFNGEKVGEDVTGRERSVKKENPSSLAIGSANHVHALTGRFDMDNLSVWYKALSDDQVTTIYTDGVNCPAPVPDP